MNMEKKNSGYQNWLIIGFACTRALHRRNQQIKFQRYLGWERRQKFIDGGLKMYDFEIM